MTTTSSAPIFRPATETDFEGILPLLRQLWPKATLDPAALHRSFLAGLSAPSHFTFCAISHEKIIGFATLFIRESLWQQSRLGYVGELVVDGAFRHRGIGAAFIRHLTEVAIAQGCARLELDSAEHRTEAHRFYERCGFERRSLIFSRSLLT